MTHFSDGIVFHRYLFFEVSLPERTALCFSLQTYIMGRFATGFLDDKDLAQLNERNLVGRLIRARSGSLLLVYNVLAEGMNREEIAL